MGREGEERGFKMHECLNGKRRVECAVDDLSRAIHKRTDSCQVSLVEDI
jgi:hypothetical protein